MRRALNDEWIVTTIDLGRGAGSHCSVKTEDIGVHMPNNQNHICRKGKGGLAGEDLPAGTWSKSSCPATPGNSEVGGEAPTREASLLSST